MSDLEALYRAVLAHPEEDTPRLMYADELESTDAARAELIRAMCELARMRYRTDSISEVLPRALELGGRVVNLQLANRERWEPACVVCKGAKRVPDVARNVRVGDVTLGTDVPVRLGCSACTGTGRQRCRWERGFPVVQVVEMRQVWWHVSDYRTPPALSWEPTPWLRDLIRTHHVTGVVPLNAPPARTEVDTERRGQTVAKYLWHTEYLPAPVFRHCPDFYATAELATAALARAVVLAALEWLDAQPAALPVSNGR